MGLRIPHAWAAAALVLSLISNALGDDIIVSSMSDGRLHRITPDGQVAPFAAGLGQPHEVEVDAAGNIYVAEVAVAGGDRITRFRPDGTGRETFYAFDSEFDNPEGLAIGSDGAVYVSGTIDSPGISPNSVYRITQQGQPSVYGQVGSYENLSAAFDHGGNLYISELVGDGGSLWRITPSQQVSRVASDLGFATGVTVAPDGVTVLVSSRFQNKIWAVSPAGAVSVYAEIQEPWALAFDSAGNLFVGQESQVTRIDALSGAHTVVATGFESVRGLVAVPEPSLAIIALPTGCLLASRRRNTSDCVGRNTR